MSGSLTGQLSKRGALGREAVWGECHQKAYQAGGGSFCPRAFKKKMDLVPESGRNGACDQ